MAKTTDIPFLIHLLDDETPAIREQVRKELKELGQEEESVLMPFLNKEEISPLKRNTLHHLLEEIRLEKYADYGWDWLKESDERKAQEEALSWLAYLGMDHQEESLPLLLDELTQKFLGSGRLVDVPNLLSFVFEDECFAQPDEQFYLPENSNLVQVIERRQGLQISLTMIVVFMARRLDLPLYGFNMPGHFLILHELGSDFRYYDPFSNGGQIPRQTIRYIQQLMTQRSRPMSIGKASTEQIVIRVFRNFMNAFQKQEDQPMYELFNEKFQELKGMIREKG